MDVAAGLELAIVAGALGAAVAGIVVASRARARASAARVALQLALERERAFIEASRRLAVAAATSIDAVRAEIDRTVRTIAQGIDAVMFFEEHEAQLICIAALGERVAYFAGTRLARDDRESLVLRALARGHRVTRTSELDARVLHPGDTFAAAIPLALEAGRTCVLYVSARSAGEAVHLDRIVAAIDQSTPAYRIARERDDDRARAEFDALTGLLSPRAFRTRLAATIERARFSPRGRVAVLFVDTDRFKSWNDTYGHASGDALLRELAQILRACASQPGDFAGRNGGDEFCVVFNDAEKSSAIERAEALRLRIAQADFSTLRPREITAHVHITASIGVAMFPVDAAQPSELLERSDEAMYHSKRAGRNAVSYFGVDGRMNSLEAPAPVTP